MMKTCLALLVTLLAGTCLSGVRGQATTATTSATCYFEGDGWCDSFNNDADCNYDGGDCCDCDCVDSTYTCGIVGYSCLDPFSSCQYHHYYDDDAFTDDTSVSKDEYDAINPVSPDDDDTDAAGDDVPLGAIIGGAAGGAVFLGALVLLACCVKTGRLKNCNCCSCGGAAGAVPPPAQAQAPAAGYPGHGAAAPSVTVGYGAAPSHAPSAPNVQAYPVVKDPPPPAYYES